MTPEYSLIFDLGRTNKKCFVFDKAWEVVDQAYAQLPWGEDEAGEACEDVQALSDWVKAQATHWQEKYLIRQMNVSAYGASLVHVGKEGKPVLPLYDYLKAFPPELEQQFFDAYGAKPTWCRQTASPWLGMLNSGVQLYWLKHHRPTAFAQIHTSLHLPQYVASLLHGQRTCEYTSLGCHTGLWDMEQQAYHSWVEEEGLMKFFPPLRPTSHQIKLTLQDRDLIAGIGIHDSSAALVPYLMSQTEPFLLLSTGTWSIALNPFNQSPLTDAELTQDCLQFLQVDGKAVKASRLFLGQEYADQVARLNVHFLQQAGYDRSISFSKEWQALERKAFQWKYLPQSPRPEKEQWRHCETYEAAYHQLVWELVLRQQEALELVESPGAQRVIVDGGFVDNEVFLKLLHRAMPDKEIWTSRQPLGSAFGALLLLEEKPEPERITEKLKLRKV
ncbi:MAG: FGGY family carbohydrate kinase [Bacteroidota bacterium]